MVEAKVLSDISTGVSFDPFRNQLVRNVDVMLEDHDLGGAIGARRPDRSLLALLTPRVFRDHPSSRLYGFLLGQYRAEPDALERDLPHRDGTEWGSVVARLGWLCFEDIEEVAPGACGWMG